MQRINDLLNTEEQIKQVVKPDFIKMFLTSKTTLLSILLAILLVVCKISFSLSLSFMIIPITGLILGALPAFLNKLFTSYYITNQKVIIEKGWIGRDYDIIKLDRVLDVNLDVTIVDTLFNTGSIKFCTANDNEPIHIHNIKNPKKIIKLVQF